MSLLWKYVRNYALYAVIAALFMICEVLTDLLQPDLMRYIIDDGIFGIRTGIPGNTDLIIRSGLLMIGLTAFGGFCGTMNNVFACIASQRAGNDMRKDCFRRIFSFSPSQIDGYTTGALITRVTNDITQIQNFIALFIRGIIRTIMPVPGTLTWSPTKSSTTAKCRITSPPTKNLPNSAQTFPKSIDRFRGSATQPVQGGSS